jgi:predicted MFS family arabinose efflux permease
VRSRPVLLRLFIISFFGIAAFASMEAIFGLSSEENFGWSANDLGWAFLAIGAGGFITQVLLLGPLVARLGEARVIVLGLTVLALSMLLQPLMRLPASGILLMGLLMTGHSLTFPTSGALISRSTPPKSGQHDGAADGQQCLQPHRGAAAVRRDLRFAGP